MPRECERYGYSDSKFIDDLREPILLKMFEVLDEYLSSRCLSDESVEFLEMLVKKHDIGEDDWFTISTSVSNPRLYKMRNGTWVVQSTTLYDKEVALYYARESTTDIGDIIRYITSEIRAVEKFESMVNSNPDDVEKRFHVKAMEFNFDDLIK